MGYCHYWEIEQEIGRESFSRIIADVERIILTLDDMGVRLAGPLGKGLPEMDAAHIAFNGLWDCGHAKNDEIVIPFPTVDAAGIGSSINAVAGSYYGVTPYSSIGLATGTAAMKLFRSFGHAMR
jgi:hypothetical protein